MPAIDRLEYVRDRRSLLAEVLTTTYGSKEVAGLVMLLGDALQGAGISRHASGRRWLDVLAEGRGAWVTNYDAYVQAVEAVQKVLDALLPPKKEYAAEGRKPVKSGAWRDDFQPQLPIDPPEMSTMGARYANQRLVSIHAAYHHGSCGSAADAADPRFLGFEMMVSDLLGPWQSALLSRILMMIMR